MQLDIKGFEIYLQEMHMDEFPMLLDDDLPDHYSDWVSQLDRSDLIAYGVRYAKAMCERGFELGEATAGATGVRLATKWLQENLNVYE